jgi:hypothetical protein
MFDYVLGTKELAIVAQVLAPLGERLRRSRPILLDLEPERLAVQACTACFASPKACPACPGGQAREHSRGERSECLDLITPVRTAAGSEHREQRCSALC